MKQINNDSFVIPPRNDVCENLCPLWLTIPAGKQLSFPEYRNTKDQQYQPDHDKDKEQCLGDGCSTRGNTCKTKNSGNKCNYQEYK